MNLSAFKGVVSLMAEITVWGALLMVGFILKVLLMVASVIFYILGYTPEIIEEIKRDDIWEMKKLNNC
jgi:predicted transcriptional regulator